MNDPYPPIVRSALFVDFDNVYINLKEHDEDAAAQFANSPDRWLTWLEQEMPLPPYFDAGRRILIRRCYLNPQTFSAFRPHFTRYGAFEVIDCPPLTARGKTSTDIHMVMDVLDTLTQPVHFNEFIILSGDADFTPVLLKLRKHDRFSVVLSIGFVAASYKAAAYHVISQDVFVHDALGISAAPDDEPDAPREEPTNYEARLLRRMGERLYEAAVLPGGIQASDLPNIYREFAEFRQSTSWLGFMSLRNLTMAVVNASDGLEIVEEDPWRVARTGRITLDHGGPGDVEQSLVEPDAETVESLYKEIAAWIRQLVGQAQAPVLLSSLGNAVKQRFHVDTVAARWLGAGTFRALLTELDLGGLREVSDGHNHYLLDPARHGVLQSAAFSDAGQQLTIPGQVLDPFHAKYPDIAPLARRISNLTEAPYLLPEHYALLFRELAREVNESGYQMTRTSKTVRDRCVERGAPIARSHVNYILVGINYSGHRLGVDLPEDPRVLAEKVVENTINYSRTAQIELNQEEEAIIRRWMIAGLDEPAAKSDEEMPGVGWLPDSDAMEEGAPPVEETGFRDENATPAALPTAPENAAETDNGHGANADQPSPAADDEE